MLSIVSIIEVGFAAKICVRLSWINLVPEISWSISDASPIPVSVGPLLLAHMSAAAPCAEYPVATRDKLPDVNVSVLPTSPRVPTKANVLVESAKTGVAATRQTPNKSNANLPRVLANRTSLRRAWPARNWRGSQYRGDSRRIKSGIYRKSFGSLSCWAIFGARRNRTSKAYYESDLVFLFKLRRIGPARWRHNAASE